MKMCMNYRQGYKINVHEALYCVQETKKIEFPR